MPDDPVALMLNDLMEKYAQAPISDSFMRLYRDDRLFSRVFSNFHKQLNDHFTAINDRARSTRHYWADSSREMITLIDEVNEALGVMKTAGFDVSFIDEYQSALNRCEPWLSSSGGSEVPEDFQRIKVIKYEPVFIRSEATVKLQKQKASVSLKMVGEGAYATVFSYTDPDYGIKFAVKRAKKDLSDRDLARFKEEFAVLKRLSFPYIVEVYKYDETRNEYKMEFCSETLRKYVARRNATLTFATRKRIALQFLYGINYIHTKDLLHRDISLQNVLLKVFDSGALVKITDFGLVKDKKSNFTRTKTEMRGSIHDPQLESFKEYNILNEIYCVGWILSYVFTGRESLKSDGDDVGRIVQKCVAHALDQRYPDVRSIISDVERLDAPA